MRVVMSVQIKECIYCRNDERTTKKLMRASLFIVGMVVGKISIYEDVRYV
ncbi:MAG: hypothetical protein ACLS8D_09310 [Clostridioides difficile]